MFKAFEHVNYLVLCLEWVNFMAYKLYALLLQNGNELSKLWAFWNLQ